MPSPEQVPSQRPDSAIVPGLDKRKKPDFKKVKFKGTPDTTGMSAVDRLTYTPRVETSELPESFYKPLFEQIDRVKDGLLSKVERVTNGQIVSYRVINGLKVREALPEIWALAEKYLPYAMELYGGELVPLNDEIARVNVNVVPIGGQQGAHVDTDPFTICIYGSSVNGGELEVLSGENARIVPIKPGLMNAIVRADELFHQVHPVLPPATPDQSSERVTIVLAYGKPGVDYTNKNRNNYFYTDSGEVDKSFDQYYQKAD